MSNQTFTYDVAQNLTANVFVRKYTVTYNYNGATGGNSASSATAAAAFNGWATSADGAKVYDNQQNVQNLATSGTVNLYANWTLGTVTLPMPTKTGYSFEGWFTDPELSNAVGASFTPDKDCSLYAKWEKVVILGDADGDGEIDVKDVVQITRYLAGGWDVAIDMTVADVNKDGKVNLKDAVLLRRYLAGGWGVQLG